MIAIHPSRNAHQEPGRLPAATEEFLAHLTDAAYRVALKHKCQGYFVDVQLDLWAALRKVVAHELDVRRRHGNPKKV
ncbi:hypothetical protein AYO44_18185 [Planctomycetaceae bacterium SCGC AG-212-F19]|nr:hypothetical protein AYO44_18185 [Planctomycetaceae bacterium SCGC AG-212-F19]